MIFRNKDIKIILHNVHKNKHKMTTLLPNEFIGAFTAVYMHSFFLENMSGFERQ